MTLSIRDLEIKHTKAMADEMADMIQRKVRSGTTPPPNAPSTIKKKGHAKTLVGSGETSDSIRAKVIIEPMDDKITGVIGVPDGKLTDRWYWNEYGIPFSESLEPSPGQRIPTRAAWRKTFDENAEKLMEKHSAALLDEILKESFAKR